jgi:hypothetical protein
MLTGVTAKMTTGKHVKNRPKNDPKTTQKAPLSKQAFIDNCLIIMELRLYFTTKNTENHEGKSKQKLRVPSRPSWWKMIVFGQDLSVESKPQMTQINTEYF